jgi:glycosyltransferase involved in cell wall biosynthesis
MNRVLIVYNHLALPSTTVRALQFRELFAADSNFQVDFIGRTSERMNRLMQRWPWRPSLRAPALLAERKVIERREAKIVQMAREYDLVMMTTVPSWSLHQQLCDLPNTIVVTDLIDALWLPWFRQFGWEHIDDMLKTSDAVICENQYTADYTRQYNSAVYVVPDSPQIEAFDVHRATIKRDPSRVTIGWIGGSNTADQLYQIFESLEDIFSRHKGLHLRLVGAHKDRLPRFAHTEFSVVESYDQSRMAKEALAMDIGIFPLFHTDESLFRGTLKTRVYMSGEVAVVGERFGENCDLLQAGHNGLLAAGNHEWTECLESLIKDRELRKRIAAAGLATVRQKYSREACYQTLTKCLTQILAG